MFCKKCNGAMVDDGFEICRACETGVLKSELEEAREDIKALEETGKNLVLEIGDRQAEIERLKNQNEFLKNAECGECKRSLAPDGDCYGCQADKLQAEIERLKTKIRRLKIAIGEAEQWGKIAENRKEWLEDKMAEVDFYASRAAAWKRCAKMWRRSSISWQKEYNFEIKSHPITEDKSEKPKTGAMAPKTKES